MPYVQTYDCLSEFTRLLATATWYGGWGTGPGEAKRDSTALFGEASEDRVAVVITQETITQTDDAIAMSYSMTADDTKTITNTGILDDDGLLGILLFFASFAGVTVPVGKTMNFTFRHRLK